jgi:phage host-nuclease inhibitor protein Gam
MARERKKVHVNVSLDTAQEAMALFSDASNSLSKIEAEMNLKMNAIRDLYQDKITVLETKKEEQVEVLEAYAYEQQDNWGKKKSYELLHGTLGFRTGTPKVKFEKGFNGKSVTAILQEQFPQYVRTVTEMDKEQLIADREESFFANIAKKAHISIVQEETFFVQSKAEQLQTA